MSQADGEWGGNQDAFKDPEEKRALFGTLDSFYQYAKVAHYTTTHVRRQAFYALPASHWQRLAAPPISYLDTLEAVDAAIDSNAELATSILRTGLASLNLPETPPEPVDGVKHPLDWRGFASNNDLDKARSTIRQFYRDWSTEGEAERTACYSPVIQDLLQDRASKSKSNSTTETSDGTDTKKAYSVLVPGAGLARLVFELCCLGFDTEGNEISFHALLASSYILNHCPSSHYHTIYPWIHTFNNHRLRSTHLRGFKIPDVHTPTALTELSDSFDRRRTILQNYHANEESGETTCINDGNDAEAKEGEVKENLRVGEMGMCASDFLCAYGAQEAKESFDAVATVFFLDTAPNLIRYIETIHHCLKQGGTWINLGPLLWHWDMSDKLRGKHDAGETGGEGKDGDRDGGVGEPGVVELAEDEILLLVESMGFVIEKREEGDSGYIQDPESMVQYTYRVGHWVARKK